MFFSPFFGKIFCQVIPQNSDENTMAEKYVHRYKKGEVIFEEGDEEKYAFLVESGQVDLYVDNGEQVVASVFKKEIFGISAAISNTPRYTKAVAAEDTECCLIFKEQINERINESDPIIRILLTNYINRLRASFKKNFDPNDDKTRITDIKSFGMGQMSKSDIKTEEQVISLIRLENRLLQALEQKEYYMNFQPIVDMKTMEAVGLEALIRLDSLKEFGPSGDNILPFPKNRQSHLNPDDFMSIAEKTSLIVPLGHWIIQKSCEQFGKLKRSIFKRTGKYPSLFISFNISSRQIIDPDFISILKKAITANRLKTKEIKVEITEKELTHEENVIKWIKEVSEMGCTVAIDDFGTGYTNFKFLSQFNIQNIKIDKSFIREIDKGANKEKMLIIIDQLIQMSQKLGVQTIAEGVENHKVCQLLQKMECDYGQGYYFSRPMSIGGVSAWLERNKQKKAA